MKTANYILGEFGSMFELYLTIEFITDCLEWKEEIKQRKVLKCVLFILLFMIAQGNGRFSNSQIIVVAIDLVLFMLYAACFLKERFQYRLLICILPFLIVSAINVTDSGSGGRKINYRNEFFIHDWIFRIEGAVLFSAKAYKIYFEK